jgi:hypothetical protein
MDEDKLKTLAREYQDGCVLCFIVDNDIPADNAEKFMAIVEEISDNKFKRSDVIDVYLPEDTDEKENKQ